MFDDTPHIEETRHSAWKGVQIGLVCGLLFGVAATVGAVLVGYGPMMPLRLGASVVLGHGALTEASAGAAIFWGLLVHFSVSVYYGLLFGLMHERFIRVRWMKNPHRLLLGMVFGLQVWAINFQIIARVFYPWFLDPLQGIIAVLHVLFYGLPVAFMYVSREQRTAGRSVHGHA